MPEHAPTPETRRELDEMLRHARALRDQARLALVRKRSAASRPHRAPPRTRSSNAVMRTVLLTLAVAILPATVALVAPGDIEENRLQQLGRYIETALPWRAPATTRRATPAALGPGAPARPAPPAPAQTPNDAPANDDPEPTLARQAARVRAAAELRFAQRLAEWEALRAP